jgi:2-polyprenyl-6-methoxyphenol hydroxylase-like FAD-dependent oxidoreductase
MARIVVAGAGICGSAAALMLARDGHDVVVLDRDEAPVPGDVEEAWEWTRRSVGQFHLPHLLLARGHAVLKDALPDVVALLRDNGGFVWNPLTDILPLFPGAEARPDDDRFETVTGRRPAIEWALASALDDEPRAEVRRGTPIAGLVAAAPVLDGVPHVTGVRLADGEELAADLVIDATGRRSPSTEWLLAIGSRGPVEEEEDVGFTYITRFFRSADGSVPASLGPGLMPCGSISLLTIPSDNGTWSATFFAAADDAPLRKLRDWTRFEKAWRSFPLHAHWLDGEPMTDVLSMSGVVDRTRNFVVDGAPVVTGMLTIGDAHACTNPSLGRGMSLGLVHTALMRDAVRAHLDDPVALSLTLDAATAEVLGPYHQATRETDRNRMAEMRAAIEGRPLEPTPESQIADTMAAATSLDPEALRWFLEIVMCLATPPEILSRPGVFERLIELSAAIPPPEPYGLDRAQLLEMCNA